MILPEAIRTMLNALKSVFAKKEDIPTKVSELENDSGYITSEDIPDAPVVPTKVSEFENDSGYITSEDIPEVPEPVQPDLAQNDETAPDYVKNRTHYEAVTVHDSITEPKIISGTVSHGYGTLRNKFCTKQEVLNQTVKMPEGKYIRITLGGVTKKITTPPAVDSTGRIPEYKEDIILDNGVTIRVSLTATEPTSGMGDPKYRYYQVKPITTPELEPYIGTPFTVELVSDEIKKLDKKYLPDDIGGGVVTLYAGYDEYIYTDNACTNKATKEDIDSMLSKGVIRVVKDTFITQLVSVIDEGDYYHIGFAYVEYGTVYASSAYTAEYVIQES